MVNLDRILFWICLLSHKIGYWHTWKNLNMAWILMSCWSCDLRNHCQKKKKEIIVKFLICDNVMVIIHENLFRAHIPRYLEVLSYD